MTNLRELDIKTIYFNMNDIANRLITKMEIESILFSPEINFCNIYFLENSKCIFSNANSNKH